MSHSMSGYNYADQPRRTPRQVFSVKPGCTQKCDAAAHGGGLILAIEGIVHNAAEIKRSPHRKREKEYHQACANGSTVCASQVSAAHNKWTRNVGDGFRYG